MLNVSCLMSKRFRTNFTRIRFDFRVNKIMFLKILLVYKLFRTKGASSLLIFQMGYIYMSLKVVLGGILHIAVLKVTTVYS